MIGPPAERVIRIGDNKGARYASDNFWMMGDTGPLRPVLRRSSTITASTSRRAARDRPMKTATATSRSGTTCSCSSTATSTASCIRCPNPSVDTGMGLERITAVLQHVNSNYDIDLLPTLVKAAARETSDADMDSPSLRVFWRTISAPALPDCRRRHPGNEGPWLRTPHHPPRHPPRLQARRARRLFHRMVPDLVAEMGGLSGTGVRREAHHRRAAQEEERFFSTIEHGMAILEGELAAMKRATAFQRRNGIQTARYLLASRLI